jgi:hypothetical protein
MHLERQKWYSIGDMIMIDLIAEADDVKIDRELLDILSPKEIRDLIMVERRFVKSRECDRRYRAKNIGYYREYYRKRSKKLAKCRNEGLDPDSKTGIGYITDILVARYLGIKTCFEITDNFNHSEYDMFEHKDWGLINAKGSTISIHEYHGLSGQPCWKFYIRKNTKADFFFCIGYDDYRKNVNRVYIIPNEDYISKLEAITIYAFGYSKYDSFREDSRPWNDLYHTLRLDNYSISVSGNDMYKGDVQHGK